MNDQQTEDIVDSTARDWYPDTNKTDYEANEYWF